MTYSPPTYRMTWRCTECAWGVTVPGHKKLVPGSGYLVVPDDQDIVHEVMFEHVVKHEPMGSYRQEILLLGADETWDDY